ncbi:MAG: YggS family pyridoxal phosphate-dependent enzyme [Lachnospiraceae bacterium]|nr:YggS family pyridoxal phosphate-dependent enzyme [Lachnospiraceae bacterium]
MGRIRENLDQIQNNINSACIRAGRDPSEVTLINVSKTKPVEMLQEAYEAGSRHFGENRVQELTAKMPVLPEDIIWHMIGHLQTNKIRYIVGKVKLIHSVDSLHLAQAIDKEAEKAGCVQDILLEMNLAEEASKFGSGDPAKNAELIREISGLSHIRLCGLMTVAPYVTDPEENRVYFRQLHDFAYGELRSFFPEKVILSMGMSGDYAVAVEEGATHVRVGTGIFGERDYTI